MFVGCPRSCEVTAPTRAFRPRRFGTRAWPIGSRCDVARSRSLVGKRSASCRNDESAVDTGNARRGVSGDAVDSRRNRRRCARDGSCERRRSRLAAASYRARRSTCKLKAVLPVSELLALYADIESGAVRLTARQDPQDVYAGDVSYVPQSRAGSLYPMNNRGTTTSSGRIS